MGDGFNNPVVGGQGSLVRTSIHSPGYVPGVNGWSINKDGTSEFHGIVITGGSLIVTSTGQGVFVYSGVPALGNLIVSIASAAGTDAVGNAYPQGLNVNQGEIDGSIINASAITAGAISAGSIGDSTIVNSDFQGGTMENTTITFDAATGVLLVYASTTTVTTLTASGNFTVPAAVTSLKVECWGGGGGAAGGGLAGGANSGGYGGGGGAYSKVNAFTVTPAQVIPYVIGSAGSAGSPNNLGTNGGITSFNSTTCKAYGGTAATLSSIGHGGASGSGVGDVKFSGGNSATATGSGGSGGGEAAGPSSNGNPGSSNTGSGTAAGGSGTSGANGGAGGSANNNGTAGSIAGGGGGGGGGGASAGNGGAGARGQIVVTYTSARTLVSSLAAIAGTDAFGNSYPIGTMISGGELVASNPVTLTGPETWHAVSYGAGWADGTAPVQGLKYRLTPQNNVEFKGAAANAAAAAAQTMFTLPVGYRPPVSRTFLTYCRTNNSVGFVEVASTGVTTLIALTAGGHTFDFDGLFFSLDN